MDGSDQNSPSQVHVFGSGGRKALTLCVLQNISADGNSKYVLIFHRKELKYYMQIFYSRDNLHEMFNQFSGKNKKNIMFAIYCISLHFVINLSLTTHYVPLKVSKVVKIKQFILNHSELCLKTFYS